MAAAKKAATKKKAAPEKKASSGSKSSTSVYTKPKLRDRLKDEIMAGEKGGKPGEWSARKSQMLAAAYKKAGGGYKTSKAKKAGSQKDLDAWTDEAWTTADGKPAVRDGETARYLPEEAWDQLSPSEKKATEVKKRSGSKQGKQVVSNTKAAKSARKKAARKS